MNESLEERFNQKWIPVPESGCWIWIASLDTHGYGHIKENSKTILAHRVSYQLFNGDIQDGFCVCHTCDERSCVNPKHLFLGTKQDNMSDAAKKDRLAKGEKIGLAKCTEELVKHIRYLLNNTNKSQDQISLETGISQSAISEINLRKTWKHVK